MKYLILFLFSASVHAYTITTADRDIEKQMLELNKTLPLEMTNDVTLDNIFVSIEQKHIFYMATVDLSEQQLHAMKNKPSIIENRINSLCSNSVFNRDIKYVFDNGWTVVYVYYDMDKEVIKTIHINKIECIKRAKNEKILIKN